MFLVTRTVAREKKLKKLKEIHVIKASMLNNVCDNYSQSKGGSLPLFRGMLIVRMWCLSRICKSIAAKSDCLSLILGGLMTM